MRAVKYFIDRFEYAMKGNGTIKVNQNDFDALNQIIEFYNTNYKNTQLEDSLILFYLLQNWKVENINNEKLKMAQISPEKQGIFAISDSMSIFRKIGMLLRPKSDLIKSITTELWVHQLMNNVPKKEHVAEETVKKILEKEIEIAKSNFSFIKELNGQKEVQFVYSEFSEEQKLAYGLK